MKFFHRYIEYLKHERKEIQKVHAVFFAAVLTAFFTGVYLYILYDIAPPKPPNVPCKSFGRYNCPSALMVTVAVT